jgi:hypothetical protein
MRNVFLVVVALVTLLGSALGSAEQWKVFRSESGFSVSYPSNWFELKVAPKRLDLLSANRRVEGAIFPDGVAQLVVEELPQSLPIKTLIENNTKGDEVLSSEKAEFKRHTANGCSQAQRVVTKDELGPGRYTIDTGFYCEVGSRKFLVFVTYYEGDKGADQYRTVAERVIESLSVGR